VCQGVEGMELFIAVVQRKRHNALDWLVGMRGLWLFGRGNRLLGWWGLGGRGFYLRGKRGASFKIPVVLQFLQVLQNIERRMGQCHL